MVDSEIHCLGNLMFVMCDITNIRGYWMFEPRTSGFELYEKCRELNPLRE